MLVTQQKINNQIFLKTARFRALNLLRGRREGIGADEIRRHVEGLHGVVPSNPSLWGNVFQNSQFKRVGDKRSTRKSCHGRWVNIWAIA